LVVLAALDNALLRVLRTRLHHPPVERALLAYTRIGEHGGLWLGIAGLGWLLHRPRRPEYARAACAIAVAYGANQAVKLAVRRRRPVLEGLAPLTPTVSPLSYPSAHAATSLAGARALRRALPAAPLLVAAAAMCLSRPYSGVHYPSDVVAGAALGTAVEALVP
jgi:membrane-associated phospholipid phosphatase